jgi:2-hydroxy-6-oxonona-2,4-dienedioate hydrolase
MTTTPSASKEIPAAPKPSITLTGLANVKVPVDVVDIGAGKPVVFLHGLVGLNDHWEEVARKVAPRSRCIMLQLPLLDLKGEDCSIHGATELTVRFLERHVREPAVLVGNSFGGHVALRIALDRPELLRGLVLAGSSGLIERTMVREVQIRPTRPWLEEKIAELFFDRAKMREADVTRAHQELSQRGHARAMVKLSRSARRNHLGERISTIKAPTLLIWGRQDIVTPPEACEELQRKVKDSRVVWFDRCGHAPMIECPDQFSDAINDFITELERRG